MAPPLARRAQTAERRAKAIQLRIAGASWQAIADALGYSDRAAAYKDVQRALESELAKMSRNAETLREMEVRRLDQLQQSLWRDAMSGDTKAVDSVLKIIDRRIRLLGLDVQPDLDEETRTQLTQQVAQRMYLVFGQVLDQLGLTEQQRAMLPDLLQAAVAGFTEPAAPDAGSRSPRTIEGTVVNVDEEGNVQDG